MKQQKLSDSVMSQSHGEHEGGDVARINVLRALLHRYNHAYYVENFPVVSDEEFDVLMRELIDLEKKYPTYRDENSPTQRVGSDISERFKQQLHQYPMLSLSNAYSEGELRDFDSRLQKVLGVDNSEPFVYICELKFDGTSISLTYENGALQRALTRGDGIRGDEVTSNVRTIRRLPLRISDDEVVPHTFEVRGEVLMEWSVFDRLNAARTESQEALMVNPRNAAAGSLKLLDSKEVAARGLSAYIYYLLGEDLPTQSHYDNLMCLKNWGFPVSEHTKRCTSIDEVISYIDYWREERSHLPFPTDGVVIKLDSLTMQERAGFTSKSPRWAVAYKYAAERVATRLLGVDFQVGRTGAVTPVANLEAVFVSGTTVRRASLHNEDFIRSFDLHYNDEVYVEKGGEIIPKVVGVNDAVRDVKSERIEFIKQCPECGSELVRYVGEAAWYCPNQSSCLPQRQAAFEHFFSRKGMNINGGEATAKQLLDKQLVQDYSDLYTLSEQQLLLLDGWKERSADNFLASIKESRKVPFERVLYSLGIRFVGEVVAKLLARAFKNIEMLRHASIDQLVLVDEVGGKIAESVYDYFQNSQNNELIDRLIAAGLKFEVDEIATSSEAGVLTGKIIVISGVFEHHSRDEYKHIIELHGGNCVGSVSSKCSFLLAGNNMGPAKLEKCRALGIEIVSEEQFLQMIEM